MTDLSTRRYRPADCERVLELHEEALRDAEFVFDVQAHQEAARRLAHQEAARRFYEENGFEVERRIEIEAFGETLDTVFYRKPLE